MTATLPPMTLVLVELDSSKGDLVPASLASIFGQAFNHRVRPTLMLAASEMPKPEIEDALAGYPLRSAAGARRIWEVFPEYRNEFVVEIERWVRRAIGRGPVALRDTYVGDRLVKANIHLPSQPFYSSIPHNGLVWRDEFDGSDLDLAEFAYLRIYQVPKPFEIEGKAIYFCDRFSIAGEDPIPIKPGVQFVSARALMESSDLLARAGKHSQNPFGASFPQRPLVPDQFSGAFLMDEEHPQAEFGQAQIGRLMAASAISTGISGIYLGRVQFTLGGMNAQYASDENTFRPFGDNEQPRGNVISADDPILKAILTLFDKVTPQTYASAKDDYRLLALDTVEDSRKSHAFPPQYAQVWMGIERLLPFRTETTSQLALALSAFAPAADRQARFAAVKQDYDLRSKIVHGYSFARDNRLSEAATRISPLFRRLFTFALRFEKSALLRDALFKHVLEGQPGAIDAGADADIAGIAPAEDAAPGIDALL